MMNKQQNNNPNNNQNNNNKNQSKGLKFSINKFKTSAIHKQNIKIQTKAK